MPKKPSKTDMVKSYLIGKGSITSLDAIESFSATRLSAIIFNLREAGWIINGVPVQLTDKAGYVGMYTRYILVDRPKY